MEKRNDFTSGGPSVSPHGSTEHDKARDGDRNQEHLDRDTKGNEDETEERNGKSKNFITKFFTLDKVVKTRILKNRKKEHRAVERAIFIPVNHGFPPYIRIELYDP